MTTNKQDVLIKAFREILKTEGYGSQGDIVLALKNLGSIITNENPYNGLN